MVVESDLSDGNTPWIEYIDFKKRLKHSSILLYDIFLLIEFCGLVRGITPPGNNIISAESFNTAQDTMESFSRHDSYFQL